MKKKNDFLSRLLDAYVDAESRVANEIGKLCRWENRNGYVPNGMYYRMQEKIKALESVRYEESDLRGLSDIEKDCIRDNEYKCFVDVRGRRYYIFIAKNATTGRKQIYGQSKKQLISPNGHDICKDKFNYSCWLILQPNRCAPFDIFCFEVRHWISLIPVAI